MSDPMFVTDAELRGAYDALGLDPERYEDTRSIRITPGEVEILRYQHRPVRFTGSGDALATELLTLQLGPPAPVDMLSLALSGPTDPEDDEIETPEQSAAIVDANLARMNLTLTPNP